MSFKLSKKFLYGALFAVLATLIIFVGCSLFVVNPLPSDRKMIDHFNANKNNFENIVGFYRGNYRKLHDPEESLIWAELLEKAGVESVNYGGWGAWIPDPYSIEKAKEKYRMLATKAGQYIPYEYNGLIIKPSPRSKYSSFHLYYLKIWKDYFYIPEIPRIENGYMLWPIRPDGKYIKQTRIVSNLDGFPDGWKDFECVFREIEPHWYLCMCNGH